MRVVSSGGNREEREWLPTYREVNKTEGMGETGVCVLVVSRTFVSNFMQPSNIGYFSLAVIGLSRSIVGSGGRAGARRENVSSAA